MGNGNKMMQRKRLTVTKERQEMNPLVILARIAALAMALLRSESAAFPMPARVRSSPNNRAASLEQTRNEVAVTRHHLVFPGGGIFFYWQAGYIDYLRQKGYDLSQSVTMTGASAGALCATLTAADVCFERATDLALSMAKDAGVWERRAGLQGVWGDMIHDWLDTLLPDDAVMKAQQRGLRLLITPLPSFGKTQVSDFRDKEELIACNMASVHIPWFINGKLVTKFRNRYVIDGSFRAGPKDYFQSPNDDSRTLILDYSQDPSNKEKNLLDAVTALSPDGIWGLLEQGRRFAEYHEERGLFQDLPKYLD